MGKPKKQRLGFQPITHRLKKVLVQWEEMKNDDLLRDKFEKPEDLTIITAHNYSHKSLFEENLDFLGVEDYVVLRHKGEWQNIMKIKLVLDYLKSGKCTTPYVLFCDAKDTIFSDDPAKIIPIYKKFGCAMLFGSTKCKKNYYQIPGFLEWANKVTRKGGRYLNAGIYIGEPEFIKEVLEIASKYVKWFDSSPTARWHREQTIFRLLHPLFHPRMDIDYNNELVYRN